MWKFLKSVLQTIYNSIINEETLKLNNIEDNHSVKLPNGKIVAFLSISDKSSRAYVYKGSGETLNDAIKSAVESYFGKKTSAFIPQYIILDLVVNINKSKSTFDIQNDLIYYKRGLEGFAFDSDFDTAFLPQEVISYHLVQKKNLNLINTLKALKNHSRSSFDSLASALDSTKSLMLYKFNTKSFFIDENTFSELYRGHQVFRDIGKQELWNTISLTKNNYFKNVVNNKGKFLYNYHPHINQADNDYNILRHAGTTYSMLETYELMPDDELLNAAQKAISYLVKRSRFMTLNGKEVKVIVEKNNAKVGGNALSIVALAKYTQLTGDKQHLPLMQDMASWLREIQGDNGNFTVHKQKYSTGKASDFVSHYYPGEAILSLVRLYQVDGNEEWLDVAERAADYLINIRDNDATIDTIAHDHWLLYGLNDLYRERKKDMYLKHAFFICDAILKTQINEGESRPELVGGYRPKSGNEPQVTPVACRSEGLGAAYNLAIDHDYKDKAEKMKKAIHNGIQFQLQMQLRPESAMYYNNKSLCLGAMQAGLKGYGLRNDYTQHNISSFIGYYKILNQHHEAKIAAKI